MTFQTVQEHVERTLNPPSWNPLIINPTESYFCSSAASTHAQWAYKYFLIRVNKMQLASPSAAPPPDTTLTQKDPSSAR